MVMSINKNDRFFVIVKRINWVWLEELLVFWLRCLMMKCVVKNVNNKVIVIIML